MKISNKLVRDKIPEAATNGRFKNKIFLESVE